MKKFLFLLLFTMAVTAAIFATGKSESQGKKGMDEIVFLTPDLHEFPEVHKAYGDAWKEITGVRVKLKTVSNVDAETSMIAQFMAGEFPDVVKFGTENLNALVRQEFIVPLDEYIEKSPGMSALKKKFPSSFEAHSVNGITYGIPQRVGSMRGIWIRTDILDALNLPMPTTIDEFVYTLKEIRDNYPGVDGKAIFPYVSKTYHSGYMGVLSNYFDISLDPIMKRPGDTKYRDGWDSPQFKDYADFVKMLWDEKLIDPDHALPQPAAKTRSKFYSGNAALISMWAYRYSEMLPEVRKQFPDAEIAMIPPIKNPKGGILGVSVLPGYRPLCITSECEDPEFVFKNFIEPMYLTVEGAMFHWRGIENIHYKIQDNMFVPNFEETGVVMGVEAPLNPDIEFPYTLSPLLQRGAEIEQEFGVWFSENSKYGIAEEPTVSLPAFEIIKEDLKDKKNQLFWTYVLGKLSFADLTSQYEAYKDEIGFDDILNELNSTI